MFLFSSADMYCICLFYIPVIVVLKFYMKLWISIVVNNIMKLSISQSILY